MKYQRYLLYLSVLLITSTEICSSTFLAGAMFYYLMGNYITREVFPNILTSALKPVVHQSNSGFSQGTGSLSANTVPQGTDTVNEMIKIGKALGINRRLDKYINELWPDQNCTKPLCDKTKKKKSKLSETESDEENDYSLFDEPTPKPTESEEEYSVKAHDDNIEDLVDEELSDSDPMNFYYIMKDEHKRKMHQRQQRLQEDNYNSQYNYGNFPNQDELVGEPKPQYQPVFSSPTIINVPGPRRGFLPIFFRYRVPYPKSINNYGNANPHRNPVGSWK